MKVTPTEEMQVNIWYQRASKPPGERIHTAVCGLLQCSLSGLRYFVLFIDSIYRNVYFLKIKAQKLLRKILHYFGIS